MKQKHKKNTTAILLSSMATYGILKIQNKIDPYTRTLIGSVAGVGIAAFIDKSAGIGVHIGSGLQLTELYTGGKLAKNQYTGNVYVLTEKSGVVELYPNQTPSYPIDGLTIKGLNGVYKVSNGVYARVDSNGQIYTTGIGSVVNAVRKAGYMNKDWVLNQPDARWMELFNLSI